MLDCKRDRLGIEPVLPWDACMADSSLSHGTTSAPTVCFLANGVGRNSTKEDMHGLRRKPLCSTEMGQANYFPVTEKVEASMLEKQSFFFFFFPPAVQRKATQ